MAKTRVPLLFGAGYVGSKGRITDPGEVQKWVDLMVAHGQVGIDTARRYSDGTSEELLAQLDLKGMRIDTKVYPFNPGDHSPAKLKATFQLSLNALAGKKIRVFYLHIPDRDVPFEETLEAVNELHQAGHFEEFGLSNFMSWEVAEVVGICERRCFVRPTVYEGIYNILSRGTEDDGGFLSGHLLAPTAKPAPGTHFDPATHAAIFYSSRYTEAFKEPVRALQACADRHSLRLAEVAYRWLQHHSALGPGDHGVILGVSRVGQLEDAIVDSEKGPLPQEVVDQCSETWRAVKGLGRPYFHEMREV